MGAFFVMILSALMVVSFNVINIKNHPNIIVRVVCLVLFTFTGLRYIALIVFELGASMNTLKLFSYFYLGSSIGITIPSALALWYIIPRFREKIREWAVLLILSPFIAFYLSLICLQPVQIIKKVGAGYSLQLLSPWNHWLSIVQGIFTIMIIFVCLLGFKWYPYKLPRSQYLLFVLGYILTTIDGISMIFNTVRPIQPFIISETFVLIAILYAFCTKPISEKCRN